MAMKLVMVWMLVAWGHKNLFGCPNSLICVEVDVVGKHGEFMSTVSTNSFMVRVRNSP